MVEIIFLGRGGQGAFTSSRILAVAASLYGGKNALSFPSFGPERRGAPVFAYTKIDDKPIRDRSQSLKGDYIVVLDESLYSDRLKERLKDGGKIILNSIKSTYDEKYIVKFDGNSVSLQFLGVPITNTAMLAALVFLTNIVTKEEIIKSIYYDLKPNLAIKNERLIEYVANTLGGDNYE